MPVRESEAIVLRSFPLGESDRLVSFLSRTYGRMRGGASGARRTKSRFGSTLEPLSYIRIWFYERETRELVRINQTELIESFLDAHRDYATGVALAVISDVCEAVLGEREVTEQNFRLILASARAIRAGTELPLALAYFSLWTVRLGGWLPLLDRCARCGAELKSGGYLSPRGTLLCGSCRLAGQRAVSQGALELARRLLGERLERLADVPFAAGMVVELRDSMLDVIEHHGEKRLPTRRLLSATAENPI